MWGFENAKDVLDVLVVPLVIFVIGLLLPRLVEKQKRESFFSLIQRELEEMVPQPAARLEKGSWPAHLTKQFIHEDIFRKPSENRDFILSLPPEIAYNEAQLWIHYDKAMQSPEPSDLAEHGASWCDYLREICQFFDKRKRSLSTKASLENTVLKPWKELIISYHPELEAKLGLAHETSRRTSDLEIYNDGKFKRLNLMFSVNGGTFAIAQLLHKNNIASFGKLTLFHLALGAIIFTIIMTADVWRWSAMMRREFLGQLAFSLPGKIVLVSLSVLIVSAWVFAGFFT